MKKIILGLAFLALVALSLFGCNDSGGTDEEITNGKPLQPVLVKDTTKAKNNKL